MITTPRCPRFRPGDHVVVRQRDVAGHSRTPGYVQGKPGVVVAYRGVWPNPELLAYRLADPVGMALYTVDFEQQVVWDDYEFGAEDRVAVDLYEHWLEVRRANE